MYSIDMVFLVVRFFAFVRTVWGIFFCVRFLHSLASGKRLSSLTSGSDQGYRSQPTQPSLPVANTAGHKGEQAGHPR